MASFKNEAELAAVLKDWLIADGWEVYSEVAPWGGGAARADMIGVRGSVVAVFETKMSLTLALMEQCDNWRPYAHVVYAAVPYPKRGAVKFQEKLLEALGVGLMYVPRSREVSIRVRPSFNRKAISSTLTKVLRPEHKLLDGGSRSSNFPTPFKSTCEALRITLDNNGGKMRVQEALKATKHHYRSDSSARSSLVKLALRGVIKGIRITAVGREMWFTRVT